MTPFRWTALVGVTVMIGAPMVSLGGCGSQQGTGSGSDAAAGHPGDTGVGDGTLSDGAADGATPSGDDAGGDDSGDGASDAATGDGATMSTACVPATACPATVTCGRYTDPCGGGVFLCGAACPSTELCVTSPTDPTSQKCEPKVGDGGVCTAHCGTIGFDPCGVAINCGGCAAGMDCSGNECVPAGTGSDAGSAGDACPPASCTPDTHTQLCGTIADGCGNTLHCTCTTGVCAGGVCAVEPPECTNGDGGAKCGSVSNACGSGTLACAATCAGDTKCVNGSCTACTPPTCGGAVCGQAPGNGCGPAVSCGTCTSENQVCQDGGCCTPQTCAQAIDAGLVTGCGNVQLGCGVQKACETCPTGDICTSNVCTACTAKTCSDFSGGCGHSDGCGKTLDCCPGGTTCQGTLCCSPGLVSYNGSCCKPACDPNQPAGTQVSCGQVLFCYPGNLH